MEPSDFEQNPDPAAEGRTRRTLGELALRSRDLATALEHAEAAVRILEATDDASGLAGALKLQGIVLRGMGRIEEAGAIYQRSLAILEDTGTTEEAAAMVNNIGLIHWRLGRFDDAMGFFERAARLFRESGVEGGESDALNNMALIHRHRERYAEALDCLHRSLAIARGMSEASHQSKPLDNLGIIYYELGELETAIEYYYQSLLIAREMSDHRALMVVLSHLSEIHRTLNDFDEAMRYEEEALGLSIALGDDRHRVFALVGLGNVCRDTGRYSRAEEYYHEAMAIARTSEQVELLVLACCRLGGILEIAERYDSADAMLRNALEIAERIGERRYTLSALSQLGAIANKRGDPAAALRYLHEGLALAADDAPPDVIATFHHGLVQTHRALGDFERALDHHERYHALRSAIINEASIRKVRNLQAVHQVERIREEADLQRLHNAELEEANRRLRLAGELKSQILAITAHDLHNPLIGIRMHMEHLMASDDRRPGDEYFPLIHRSVNEMLAAIRNQLNFAAIESDELAIERAVVGVREVAEDVIAMNRRQLAGKGQHVELDADGDVPALGDRGKIHDIIANLITNAMKYSPRDTVISVTLRSGDGMCAITVADQGPGIAAADREHLFKRFRRLGNLPTDGESSTGLGLWITKRLVELHGGTIRLDPADGGGRFIVELPGGAMPTRAERGRA